MAYTYPFQIPSGVDLLPELSGIHQLGNQSLPFDTIYTQSLVQKIRTVTSTQTLALDDSIVLTNQGAAIQLNIPITPMGKSYTVIDISNTALTNPVTLSGIGANINGALTSTININRSSTIIFSDGTNYWKATSIL